MNDIEMADEAGDSAFWRDRKGSKPVAYGCFEGGEIFAAFGIEAEAVGEAMLHPGSVVVPLYADRGAPSNAIQQEGKVCETQSTINEWISTTFGDAGSNFSVAARANEEMAELLMGLAADDGHPNAVVEVADIVIILYRLADRFGCDLHEEVNRKMAINRRRRWNVSNGHGYHQREPMA